MIQSIILLINLTNKYLNFNFTLKFTLYKSIYFNFPRSPLRKAVFLKKKLQDFVGISFVSIYMQHVFYFLYKNTIIFFKQKNKSVKRIVLYYTTAEKMFCCKVLFYDFNWIKISKSLKVHLTLMQHLVFLLHKIFINKAFVFIYSLKNIYFKI